MGRHEFSVDTDALTRELDGLTSAGIRERIQFAEADLYGPGSDSEDVIQDCAMLEQIAVEQRAVISVGNQILAHRKRIKHENTELDGGSRSSTSTPSALEL